MKAAAIIALVLLGQISSLASAQGISHNAIRIGILTALSVPFADRYGGELAVAAQMAIDEFSRREKDLKVVLLTADHQNKPDVAATIVRKWLEVDNVDAILNISDLPVANAVYSLTIGRVILILSGISPSQLRRSGQPDLAFNWDYNAQLTGLSTAAFLVRNGATNISLVSQTTEKALEGGISQVVSALGGKILERTAIEPGKADLWSGLKAGANNLGILITARNPVDLAVVLQQTKTLGITSSSIGAASPLFITDIDRIGLQRAAGLIYTTSFYWDLNSETRAWAQQFMSLRKEHRDIPPTMVHAGIYSAIKHYLKSVAAARSDAPLTVAEKLRSLPVQDPFSPNGKVRANGQVTHPAYVMQVKTGAESSRAWDYARVLDQIRPEAAEETACGTPCPKSGACPQNSDQPNCPCPKSGACPQH